MTVLSALAAAYDRLAGEGRAPPYGYSMETFDYVVALNPDGSVVQIAPLGDGAAGRALTAPRPVKRSFGIAANFLWDNTGYALGVAAPRRAKESDADYERRARRAAKTHAAFVRRQREALRGTDDEGLVALLRFLESWRPCAFAAPLWPDDMRGKNVAFALESQWRGGVYLHDRPAAQGLWRVMSAAAGVGPACLATGARGPVARLHPSIGGVWGAQSSGASLVSFNLPAFQSYGAKQGDNAPVSETAAFAYAAALDALLAKGSPNRVQIGDASTVFWSDASGAAASTAERLFRAMLQGPERHETDGETAEALELLRNGRVDALRASLGEGGRLHVLGLAPNAGRLSVRFWVSDEFSRIAAHYARHAQDMAIEPAPNPPSPGFGSLLLTLAPQGARDNAPANLAGEWLRAALTGGRYPQTLLVVAAMRARAEKRVDARRAAIFSAVLRRNHAWEAPVALDPDNPSQAYQLGRLLAVLEQAQRAALGPTKTAIADRHYATASSMPARAFGPLLRALQAHVADARRRGRTGWIGAKVGQIMKKLDPELPAALSLEDQARFAVGYYHEKATRRGGPADAADEARDDEGDGSDE